MIKRNWERFRDKTVSETWKAYHEDDPKGSMTFGTWLDLVWADAPTDDAQGKPTSPPTDVLNADGRARPGKPKTAEDVMRGLGGLLGAGLGLALAGNQGEPPNVTVYVTCNGK